MPTDLTPVIAASTRWLLAAYPAPPGPFARATAEAQARQATTVAAALCYSTAVDVELLHLLGPGGSIHLDHVAGTVPVDAVDAEQSTWRTWVCETVVSWAASLLADPTLAGHAHQALATTDHAGIAGDPRRLTLPAQRDTDAAPLLRHPDLVEPIAALHRDRLLALLDPASSPTP